MPVFDPISGEHYYTKQEIDRMKFGGGAGGGGISPNTFLIQIADWTVDGDKYKATKTHGLTGMGHFAQARNSNTGATFLFENDDWLSVPGDITIWLNYLPDFITILVII